MPLHEVRVFPLDDDPAGQEIRNEAARSLGVDFDAVGATTVYRLEGASLGGDDVRRFARSVLVDSQTEGFTVDTPLNYGDASVVEVGYKPGVMNPAAESIRKAGHDAGIGIDEADASVEYSFFGGTPEGVQATLGGLLVNRTVQQVITERPTTLRHEGSVSQVAIVPFRRASIEDLRALSKDKLFLDDEEMGVVQRHFQELGRDPTDAELEIIAARWSEHCGHKTFNAVVMVDGQPKEPLFSRIRRAAKANFGDRVVSAFDDNSGVIRFYDDQAICAKVETHNSPSAVEPYGGAMTGSGGVFRDIMGTGQGAKTIISTNMFCFAPPDTAADALLPGTLSPDYLQRRVVQGVRDYGNRMGIPTANGSVHYHPDFRAKPSVIVGAYGILPEARAQKGEPQVGDLVVIIGGRTGRDGIHGATFSSGEMTDKTASVNSSAVQIGNAIEEKRTFDALLAARDADLIRALTDCGAAGFSSAIGELGEDVGLTVDISKAPLKYPGLAPWEIWLSESQERMVAAIAPENIEQFQAICARYNVEATVLGNFDGTHTLTVNYGNTNVAELDYEFLKHGLPQRIMEAHWEPGAVLEFPPSLPAAEHEWTNRFEAVLAHGNVCSKEPIVRQYDHGVQGGAIVSPFGGVNQDSPNDAFIIRPLLDRPYGIVQSHGMNPILNRLDPYQGTVWAVAEAAANYVAAGGNLREAGAVGNYIWPFPDREAMGSLDRSVDAAVDMMHLLKLPVVSGKDSLSSTYRGNGEVIKIPPVYTMSIFGPMADVEKSMTTDIKQPGSTLVLVGNANTGMGGSTYYDVAGGSSGSQPLVDTATLPAVLDTVYAAIQSGEVLACHDISEGGLATAVAEMCFGGDCGVELNQPGGDTEADTFLFNETAGCFVVEVASPEQAKTLFGDVPYQCIGTTTQDKTFSFSTVEGSSRQTHFAVPVDQLKAAWQQPMKEIFHA